MAFLWVQRGLLVSFPSPVCLCPATIVCQHQFCPKPSGKRILVYSFLSFIPASLCNFGAFPSLSSSWMLKLHVQGPPGRELLVKMKLLGLEVLMEIDIAMGSLGVSWNCFVFRKSPSGHFKIVDYFGNLDPVFLSNWNSWEIDLQWPKNPLQWPEVLSSVQRCSQRCRNPLQPPPQCDIIQMVFALPDLLQSWVSQFIPCLCLKDLLGWTGESFPCLDKLKH